MILSGLRTVPPYTVVRELNAKKHWVGRSVREVCAELGVGNVELLAGRGDVALELNRHRAAPVERVDGEAVLDRVVAMGDVLHVLRCVHEPPVPWSEPLLWVVQHHNHTLVVNKPAGIPVHPTGPYHQNTVVEMLRPVFGTVSPVHRLDRLTLGVLVLATSSAQASVLGKAHMQGGATKTYLARVRGRFVSDGWLVCTEKIPQVYGHGEKQLLAETHFRTVVYNAELHQTVVEARPVTGRTHQIRLHLKHLGTPIANDPAYALTQQPRPATDPCPECGRPLAANNSDHALWLHAWTYSTGGETYTAPPPAWTSI